MSTLAEPRPACPAPEATLPPEDTLRAQVWKLMAALYPRRDLIERRAEFRYPYPYLIHLLPLGPDGTQPEGEPIVVVGKHLSERGLGFFHPKPLPYRRMMAVLESSAGQQFCFLIDVHWCRFTKKGWYESGGRFLQVVDSSTAPGPAKT